jgi:malonyl-CoA decarboxylase
MKLAELFGLSTKRKPASGRGASRAVAEMTTLCHSLLSERGEVSGTRLATGILTSYQALDAASRARFFDALLQEFSPIPEEVGQAGDAYRQDPSPENLARLQRVVEPPRQELFRRLNMAPDGTPVLVGMRRHLLQAAGDPSKWAPIAADLAHLFASWFNRGFLELRRIDWDTSATVLEKLIQYEAVHQIQGWNDLRRRLQDDRRCYAFFHPALPDEPIIFVEAALTQGIGDKVQPLLDPDSPVARAETADCAVFYAITNCQEGLRGVPFGNFLLKQVLDNLSRELPRLRRFATLSPLPGFRAWLAGNKNLAGLAARLDDPAWPADPKLQAELQRVLVPLSAYYLLKAKQGQKPLDSVARFHLRNGARLERINWLGDISKAGLERSAGLMVNYVYRLAELERNHELYARSYQIVASSEIEALAKQALTKRGAPAN